MCDWRALSGATPARRHGAGAEKMPVLVQLLTAGLVAQLAAPYVFFGASAGALMACELTRGAARPQESTGI